jgi:peptidoglycan-associated lipoprotein
MKNKINIRLQVKVFGLLLAICVMTSGCRGCRNLFGANRDKQPDAPGFVEIETEFSDPANRGGVSGEIPIDAVDPDAGAGGGERRPPSREPEVEEALTTVHFDYDSSVLTPKTQELLLENVAWLRANAQVPIIIEGHCDERGTVEYNLSLGDRRAKETKKFLVNNGINPERIYVISYGKERPVDPGHGEVHWWKNRRAEFKRYK